MPPRLRGRVTRRKARVIKEMIKSHRLDMSTYIGRAMLEMQDKDYIMAPYYSENGSIRSLL